MLYNALKPFEKSYDTLRYNHYNLATKNVNNFNKWAEFKDEGNGIFFIHPGDKKPVIGIFEFHTNKKIILNFSIRNNYKKGKIKFTIKHNKQIINNSIVTYNNASKLLINVNENDTLKIIADKYGDTSYDWGDLKISTPQSSFFLNEILVPLLWSVLFIFLIHKKYLFIALNSLMIYTIFIIAEKLNFGSIQLSSLIDYTLIMFLLTLFFLFLYKKSKLAPAITTLISILVYFIPLFFIIYILNFNTSVSQNTLYAIFQSNALESYEYISDFIKLKYIILVLFVFLLSGTLLFFQNKLPSDKINNKLFLILFLFLMLTISYKQIVNLKLPNFIVKSFTNYFKEIQKFKKVQEKRKTKEIQFQADKESSGETYIIVIGESLNKKHMGLYGYFRDTTPNLSSLKANNELLIFDNVYSNHTHTVPVLSLSLTEANQYNNKEYFESLSIIEILNKANFETYWLSNQIMYGGWDNMVSVIATASKNLISLNSSIGYSIDFQKHDGILIERIQKILNTKSNKNRAIFVHLIGNHSTYQSKYPKGTYSKYQEKLTRSEVGYKASKNKKINHYDNSVLYNDYVVSSILNELKKQNTTSAFIYMSDHADDVVRDYGHSIDKFTYEMTQIPMIAWFSNTYKQNYNNRYQVLSNNTQKIFSNDMLYDTLIGMLDIDTDQYDAKFDLSSQKYSLKEEEALVIHGKKRYANHENYIYWQRHNIKFLFDNNLSSKVIPNNIKSKAKEKEVYNSGFKVYDKHLKNKSEVYKSNLSLKDPHFKTKLLDSQLIKDQKIKYITVDFTSQFD